MQHSTLENSLNVFNIFQYALREQEVWWMDVHPRKQSASKPLNLAQRLYNDVRGLRNLPKWKNWPTCLGNLDALTTHSPNNSP